MNEQKKRKLWSPQRVKMRVQGPRAEMHHAVAIALECIGGELRERFFDALIALVVEFALGS